MRFRPLLLVASLLPMTGLLLALGASPAEACSPPPFPQPYFTLGETRPAQGAVDVPLDGAVLLTSRSWQVPDSGTPFSQGFEGLLTVTVTDLETGAAVPGQLKNWLGEPFGAAWRPDALLLPVRRYELVATLNQTLPRPAEAQGPTQLRLTFTTGQDKAPPLQLLGPLEVSFESVETDKLRCEPSLCECVKDGREHVPQARLRVPAVQGGVALGAYRVELWVTDRTPYVFDEPGQHERHDVLWGVWGVSTSGAATDTLFKLPQHPEGEDYPPCFALRAVDPAGHEQVGAPVCFSARQVPFGGEGGFGCSAGAGGLGSLGLAGALVALLRARRRDGNA